MFVQELPINAFRIDIQSRVIVLGEKLHQIDLWRGHVVSVDSTGDEFLAIRRVQPSIGEFHFIVTHAVLPGNPVVEIEVVWNFWAAVVVGQAKGGVPFVPRSDAV